MTVDKRRLAPFVDPTTEFHSPRQSLRPDRQIIVADSMATSGHRLGECLLVA